MEEQFDFVKYLSKMNTAHIQINDPEEYLFNIVSCCLLKEIRYYDSSEQRFSVLLSALNKIANDHNPEFILKVAVYLRHQLYIRTTTNFLIAFSCLHGKTKQFVKKYFGTAVLLPTDLIEVCSYVQYLIQQMKKEEQKLYKEEEKMEIEIDVRKKLVFPKILKECIAEKFPQFSLYQLGKYCSDGARKKMLQQYLQFKNIEKYKEIKEKQRKKNQKKAQDQNKKVLLQKNIKKHKQLQQKINKVFKKNQFDVKFLCMKDIISLSHIKSPQYPIRCILGTKYPQTEAEFNLLFKEEIEKYQLKSNKNQLISFNQNLAAKRMKLDIPTTWETQLSAKGNKKEVWEQLIMENSVPYMAMIRNLRNILKSGVSDVIHQKVIAKITDLNQVKNSKMFPFQYFSALVEVDKLINHSETFEELKEELMEQELAKIIEKADAGLYNSDAYDPEAIVEQQIKNMQKQALLLPEETKNIIKQVGPFYKQAINKAISIAVDQNLEPIRGLTIVFADVSGSMQCPISGGKRYGSIRNCMDIAILFGLMIRSKCANCQFYLFSSPGEKKNKLYQKVKLLPGDDYLENLKLCKQQNKLGGGNTGFPGDCIKKYQQKNMKIDNIIILSDLMISVNYSEGMDNGQERNNNNKISDVLNEYRNSMNEHLKIFSIDLRGYSQQLNLADEFNEQNYIRIFGMSESVLKFISLRECSQMQEIHNFAEVKVAEYESNLKK